jgi:restriction system protein
MAPRIEDEPRTWRALEERVACILRQSGVSAEVGREIATARGTVVIDVWAHDASATPAQTYLLECKHWRARVTKSVVHAFRSVVGDSGANWGAIISQSGFQSGAHEAARYSNVRLITWLEFQSLLVERWFQRFFLPAIRSAAEPLIEYCEPVNSRVQRKAEALLPHRREAFMALRKKYLDLMGYCLMNSYSMRVAALFTDEADRVSLEEFPALPLLGSIPKLEVGEFPRAVLEAVSFRPLLETTVEAVSIAATEFDSVFGGRA